MGAVNSPLLLNQDVIQPHIMEQNVPCRVSSVESLDPEADREKDNDNDKPGGDKETASHSCNRLLISEKQEFDMSVQVKTSMESKTDTHTNNKLNGAYETSNIFPQNSPKSSTRGTGLATYISTQLDKGHEIDSIVHEFETYARKSKVYPRGKQADMDVEDEENEENLEDETTDINDTDHIQMSRCKTSTHTSVAGMQRQKEGQGKIPDDIQRTFTRDTTFTQENSILDAHLNLSGQGKVMRPSSEYRTKPMSLSGHGPMDESPLYRRSFSAQSHRPNFDHKHRSTPEDQIHSRSKINGHSNATGGKRFQTNKVEEIDVRSINSNQMRDLKTAKQAHRPNPDGLENEVVKKVPLPQLINAPYAIPGFNTGPYGYTLPTYHPPPALHENGITRENLLDVLSKGLGEFTNEMAVVILDKLKIENESLANQVGSKVKDEAIEELKCLRTRVSELERERNGLKETVEKLKVDTMREKEQIKRENEKDKLKRLKEFEEKSELIAKLQEENEKLRKDVKDREKSVKKATLKAKNQEEKVLLVEEEHKQKIKEIQKQLDRFKGDLLVEKSKKRLQATSSGKDREKTRLISHHGPSHKQYTLPHHEPYVEGDS